MVPWMTEEEDKVSPSSKSTLTADSSLTLSEPPGAVSRSQRLLSSEKYNSIKARLAGGVGGPAGGSSSSASGHTKSSSSGEQFQKMTDVIQPPPGHPFLKARPTKLQSFSTPPPFLPPSSNLPPPSHSVLQTSQPINAGYPATFSVPPPTHPAPSQFDKPQIISHPSVQSYNPPTQPRQTSLFSDLTNMPSAPRELATADILSLVLRLSSVRVPSEAKKSGLLQLLKIPNITEPLVHQLLTMENGDLFGGLKCVLPKYMEHEAEDTSEVLELTLSFINKCLALQKQSPKLRSLVVGKSRELAVTLGGMSVLEQLVMVSKTRASNTVMVNSTVCGEITQELRNVQPGRLLGTCYSAWDLQGEVASWLKLQLGIDMQTISSVFVRSMEEKFRVVEVSLMREDLTETSLHVPLLSKYSDSFWPAVHTVRKDQGSPCMCLTVVQFLPTGHLLAYTDLDWQRGLGMLDQELQYSQTIPLQSGARDLQIGHMVTAAMSDMQLSTTPLYQFTLARAVITNISEEKTVKLYLMDHGMEATVSIDKISSLPPTLKTLPPRLMLCRVQGVTPTPSTKIVAESIVTLSHLTNSATAVSLVVRPTLSTPKVLCQLISSQQINLIIPALNILHGLASTQASLKHLVISHRNFPCVAIDLILPTIFNLFSTCLETLSLRTVSIALETIHCLLVPLQGDQLRTVFSNVDASSILAKVENCHTLGQYQAVLDKVLEMDPGRRYKSCPRKREEPGQIEKTGAVAKVSPSQMPYRNTDIRERTPQQTYNPHRIVTTAKQIWSSVDQLENKHRRETVADFVNKGQLSEQVGKQLSGQVTPMVDPDMERRRQERENLTANAMKLFHQHKGILENKSEVKSMDSEVPTDMSQSNADSQKSTKVGSEDSEVLDVPTKPSVLQPTYQGAPTDQPAVVSLPTWLGGGDTTSSSEDEDEEHGQDGLPPWLSKSAQATHASVPVMDQLAKSVAKLPFTAALESSSSPSSSQEDSTPVKISHPLPVETAVKSPPITTKVPVGRQSPEECGSGTESSREVHSAMGYRVKETREQERMKLATQNNLKVQEDPRCESSSNKITDQEQSEQQILTRDFIFSEKHSISVELWDVERKSELDNNRLAVLICGFLNTRVGGTIYAGVKRNGLVRGVPLERKDRDTMRQMLDRVLASMINPRVPPNVVDIDFVAVEDKSRPSCPYRLMVVMVKGQKEGLNKVYMAHNLTSRSTVDEGAYVRKGHGPSYNIRLGHEEMLRLVEKRL